MHAIVYTADTADARRGWKYVDHAILTALSTFPDGTHGVDRLAGRLPEGIREGLSCNTIAAALDAFVADGLVDEVVKRRKGTLERVVVHELSAAGRALLDGRNEYRKAA